MLWSGLLLKECLAYTILPEIDYSTTTVDLATESIALISQLIDNPMVFSISKSVFAVFDPGISNFANLV